MKRTQKLSLPGMQRHASALRIVMIVFAAFLFTAMCSTAYFVYVDVYNTIGDVRSLILESENFGFEIIDFNRLSRVQAQWDKKQSTSTTSFARDPFYAILEPVTTSSTPE